MYFLFLCLFDCLFCGGGETYLFIFSYVKHKSRTSQLQIFAAACAWLIKFGKQFLQYHKPGWLGPPKNDSLYALLQAPKFSNNILYLFMRQYIINYTFISRTHLPKGTCGAQLKNYYWFIYIQHHMKESFEINDHGN